MDIIAGDSLCAFLRESCERAAEDLPPGRASETVSAVRERLGGELLRIAVGGRLNAGKSTLVNALLGEKLAATDATECTKLVSWFTYGLINQVVIRRRDGRSVTLPGQPLADALTAAGCAADEVSEVEVRSVNPALRDEYTLVDTPGLNSLSGLDDLSLAALAQADVLLYVMPLPGQRDADALDKLREAAAAAGITAVSTIGVLSRIDDLGDARADPWQTARQQAGRYGRRLVSLMSAVIPVVGLLAETALGDGFSEDDMRPLIRLDAFGAERPGDLADALRDADAFLASPRLPLTPEDRERLLSMLGMYGLRHALDEVRSGVRGAPALCKALRVHSGIDVLFDQLRHQFTGLSDPLRARRAITELDRVAWTAATQAEADALARLRDDLALAREHPRLRQFGLVTSLADLEAGTWDGPPGAAEELAALATGTSVTTQLGLPPAAAPDDIRTRLLDRITAWRVAENTSPRTAARHARAVREYLESLFVSVSA